MIRNRTLEVIDAEENYLYEIISVTEDEYNKAQEGKVTKVSPN